MSDDPWETTEDPWFTEPTTWPVRQPHLPPLSAREFETQVMIPMPRGSSEWLDLP